METPEFYDPDEDLVDDNPFLQENGRFPIPPPSAPSEPEPPPKKRRGCWLIIIALIVIFSLVASSLVSLFWLSEDLIGNWTPPWASPTPSLADAGRIAYIGNDGQVFTIQPDGTNQRQLTDDDFPYQFPAWATGSGQLAVLSGTGSVVTLLDTKEPNPVTLYESGSQAPFYLYWSPDNSQISFLSNSLRGIALRVVDTDGSGEAEVRGFGTPFYWDWLRDGSQMLVHTGATGESARLGLLQEDGQVENIAPPGAFQAPGISANGRYWAYAEDIGAGNSWLVITDTENDEQWTERHPATIAMSWSPVADQLAFTTGIQNENSFWGPLRMFDTATGEVTLLSDNIVIAFFWSPNGRYLAAFNTGDIDQDIGVNVADYAPRNRAIHAKPANQPNPHQFNLAIIDIETGDETQVMSFNPTILFISQFLPFFDQYALSHNIWSPNSDAIVLPVREDGESRVKVVRIDGSDFIDLGQGDMAFWSR
jgi:TolB protein